MVPRTPGLEAVSTEEIDGEDDPLERPGIEGEEDEGMALTITPLCFWRMGTISLI